MVVTIRRTVGDDWQTLREIRLAALQDSPSAFGSSYAKEAAFTKADWRAWAAGRSKKATKPVMFLAFDGDDCVGLVGCFDNEGRAVMLISMWVAPRARGSGIGEQLIDVVVEWARSIERDTVELWVTRGNDAAETLYRRKGFEVTDDERPLPSDDRYRLRRMELSLARRL